MTNELNRSEEFVSKIRAETARSSSKTKRPRGLWKTKLLKGLGWLFIGLGVFIALLFFVVMESTYAQLGNLVEPGFVSQLEGSPEMDSLTQSIGIDWVPDFVKIYSIRFPIILAVLGLFGCLSLIVFSIAHNRKKNQ